MVPLKSVRILAVSMIVSFVGFSSSFAQGWGGEEQKKNEGEEKSKPIQQKAPPAKAKPIVAVKEVVVKEVVVEEEVSDTNDEQLFDYNVSGFVDGMYQWKHQENSPGFLVNDGAVYLSAEYASSFLFIDLPFAWDENGTNGNDFKFAKGKPQAFVGHHLGSGFSFQVGQFDTIYGFELNDSVDLSLTQPGEVFNAFLPVTHTGALFSFENEVFNSSTVVAKLLVANPDNQGALNGENLEFGAQLGLSYDFARWSASYLFRDRNGPEGKRHFISFLGGISPSDKFDFDFEFDILDDSENANMGLGLMALASAKPFMNDKMSVSARFDLVSKMPDRYKVVQLAIGPQYEVNEHFKLKADYSWKSTEAEKNGGSQKLSQINASAIFHF